MNKAALQDNMQKQKKRLTEQLEEIEQMKDELDAEEYDSLKKETLEQLDAINKGLDENAAKKVEIKENKIEGVIQALGQQEATGLRDRIHKLEQAYNLKQISQEQLKKEKLILINQLSELKIQLTQEEQKFQHEHTGKGNFVVQKVEIQGEKYISEANDQIKKHM